MSFAGRSLPQFAGRGRGSPAAPSRGAAPAPAPRATPAAAPAAPAEPFGKLTPALAENLSANQDAINGQLAKLTEFVGDGKPWTVELSEEAVDVDRKVTADSSYMENRLFETIDTLLQQLNRAVRRHVKPDDLARASASRTVYFDFIDIDDMPRQYLGDFQAVINGEKLTFVGPVGHFRNNVGNNLGGDLPKALMAAEGKTGPTEEEKKLAEALAAIAATSSLTRDRDDDDGAAAASSGGGKTCRMCKGTGKRVCNHCHGKGGRCTPCSGSGVGRFKCISCKGAGTK